MMSDAWFVLILVCLLLYVVLDGYDLGDRHRQPVRA